jgi:prolyl-tRNA synthetase
LGRKTERERFAGATTTLTIEAMMGDGKALQMATSHELGQNFSRAFDITFVSAEGREELAWTTSWGTTTRMLGGLFMTHGDDHGLRLPPFVAPVQVLVMVVRPSSDVDLAARLLVEELRERGVRVELDEGVDTPFGRRAVDAELKGIPVRVEVGPRDLADGNVVLARRVDRTKKAVPLVEASELAQAVLAETQQQLYTEAAEHLADHTVDVVDPDEAVEACRTGWARIAWSRLGPDGEARLAQHGVSVRCLQTADGHVPESDGDPGVVALLARAY